MKRLLIPLALAAALALTAPTGAFGILGTEYEGDVADDPGTFIGFNVKKTDSGKKVKGMLLDGLPYECEDDPPGTTEGHQVLGSFKVQHREFEGTRDAVDLKLVDPAAMVTGKLKPGGEAKGTIRLKGEIAGPGSDCDTGKLEWKAGKLG